MIMVMTKSIMAIVKLCSAFIKVLNLKVTNQMASISIYPTISATHRPIKIRTSTICGWEELSKTYLPMILEIIRSALARIKNLMRATICNTRIFICLMVVSTYWFILVLTPISTPFVLPGTESLLFDSYTCTSSLASI